MQRTGSCPICFTTSEIIEGSTGNFERYECPRCGEYDIYLRTVSNMDRLIDYNPEKAITRKRANISSKIRQEQSDLTLKDEDITRLSMTVAPKFKDRADKLLLFIESKTEYAGQSITISDDECLGFSWTLNKKELREVYKFLVDANRIQDGREVSQQIVSDAKITPDGWAHLEKLNETNPDSKQGFVAMWLDDNLDEAGRQICNAIDDAGYAPYLEKNKNHIDKVDDEIIKQIRRSRFMVADFTGQRQNVYYEAGFAMGFGVPVIWTCHKDYLDNKEDPTKKLHFDIQQYNHIVWTDPEKLRDALAKKIEANFGQGPNKKAR